MPRNLDVRRSPIHGNGVFAARRLPAGKRLIRYRGRLLRHDEADALYGGEDDGHTFLFTLNDQYVVDANVGGNSARWINHGCAPNCEAVILEDADGVREQDRVYIETLREIEAGEELVYDYGIVLDEPHTPAKKKLWGCRCGHRDCTGTMLKAKRPRRVR